MIQLLCKVSPQPRVSRDERHYFSLQLEETYPPSWCDYVLVNAYQTWAGHFYYHRTFTSVAAQEPLLQSMTFRLTAEAAPIVFGSYNLTTNETIMLEQNFLDEFKRTHPQGMLKNDVLARDFWQVCEDEGILEEGEDLDELYHRLTYHPMQKTRFYAVPRRAISTPTAVDVVFSDRLQPQFHWVFHLPDYEGTASTSPIPWQTLDDINRA